MAAHSAIPNAELSNCDYLYWKIRSEIIERKLLDAIQEANEFYTEAFKPKNLVGAKKLEQRTSRISGLNHSNALMAVVLNSKTQFAIEMEVECELSIELNIINDLYPKYFTNNPSNVFIFHSENTKGENFIMMVNKNDTFDDTYNCLEITKKGQTAFLIHDSLAKIGEKGFAVRLSKSLTSHYISGKPITRIKSTDVKQKIIKIQEDFPSTLKFFSLAIIYSKLGQTDPHEMFKNKPSDAFNKFLKDVMELNIIDNEKNKAVTWKHFQLTYHIATLQNADEHRRDIGNCPSMIFFKEEGEQFDTAEIGKLGMIPQIFCVVQPSGTGFRVGCFTGSMNSFTPALPANYIFKSNAQLKEFLLTKLHNGLIELVFQTSPMNRSFILKRQEAIDSIVNSIK